ncbi:MAG: EcsC family protein [Pirellulales bacterium]
MESGNDDGGLDDADKAKTSESGASTAITKLEQKADELVRWLTDRAISGVPPLSSASDLADEYLIHEGYDNNDERVDSLIKWECSKNFAAGFVTGLGGLITMPVAVPAALGASWIIQARMAAAIARIYGHSLDEDKVRTFVLLTLLGGEAAELLREVGVKVGSRLTLATIKRIPGKSLSAINRAVGFRLLSNAGQKGVINLTKLVPVAGGVVGGAVDLVACQTVGRIGKKVFRPEDAPAPANETEDS